LTSVEVCIAKEFTMAKLKLATRKKNVQWQGIAKLTFTTWSTNRSRSRHL